MVAFGPGGRPQMTRTGQGRTGQDRAEEWLGRSRKLAKERKKTWMAFLTNMLPGLSCDGVTWQPINQRDRAHASPETTGLLIQGAVQWGTWDVSQRVI